MVLGLALLCAAAAAGYALLMPDRYVVSGSFLLRHGGEDVAVTGVPGDEGRRGDPALLGNAPHLLRSPTLLRRVVERVGAERLAAPAPGPSPEVRKGTVGMVRGWLWDRLESWRGETEPAPAALRDLVEGLDRAIDIQAPARSSLVTVEYSGADPALAREVLGVFMEEAVEHHVSVYSDTGGIEMVEQHHADARSTYFARREAYGALLEELGVVDFDVELTAAREELETARRTARTLGDRVQSLELKQTELAERIAGLEPVVRTEERLVTQNPQIAHLRESIRKKENELRERLAVYTDRDSGVKTLRATITALQRELQLEEQVPFVETTQHRNAPNPELEAFRTRLAEVELDLRVERDSVARAQERLQKARERYDLLAARRQEHDTRRDALARARRELDQAESALALASTKRMLNGAQVSALTPAQLPTEPVLDGPRRSRIALGGLLLGLFAGLGLAFVRTVTDPTVRTPDDLDDTGAGPVLASVPRFDRRSVARHQRIRHRGA